MTDEFSWHTVSDEARIQHLSSMFVERDIEERIHSILDLVRNDHKLGKDEPRNVLISGETGVGKSKILARYLQKNPDHRSKNGSIVRPVLLVEIKNASNPTSLAKLILTRLGIVDSRLLIGSTADLSETIKVQCIGQKVELVIIDEFSNAIPETGRAQASNVANWVKDLSKAKTRTASNPFGLPGEAIPFALCGTKKVERIVDPSINDELSTLTPFRIEVPRYSYGTLEQRDAFRDFLVHLDNELPFDDYSGLGHVCEMGLSPLADKIHLATYGVLRLLGHLVLHAAELAIAEGSAKIMEYHLWQSIEDQRGILQAALRETEEGKVERGVINPFKAGVRPKTISPLKKTGRPHA